MKILITDFSNHGEAIRSLRHEVFVIEQGVPQSLELDDHDQDCQHVLVLEDEQTVGTGRILDSGKIGRVAVRASYRHTGIGTAIINKLEEIALTMEHKQVYLHAQQSVIPFYQRLGYKTKGGFFTDAGIVHIEMIKPLNCKNGTSA